MLAFFQAFVHLSPDLVLQRGLGQDFSTPGNQLLDTRNDIARSSSTSRCWWSFRSGEQPDISASWPGCSIPRNTCPIADAPRRSSRFSRIAQHDLERVISMRELSQRLKADPSNVKGLIDRLEARFRRTPPALERHRNEPSVTRPAAQFNSIGLRQARRRRDAKDYGPGIVRSR